MEIENCPELDIYRSPIAQSIAELAQKNNFFLSHYEYRYQLPVPAEWENVVWKEKPIWEGGYLRESKYQSFRNDLRIGSFHPGHQSKWSTHELCHSICGFAWNNTFSFLDHCLAARLSELIPVIVFYFLDEINLNRCKDHLNNLWLKMPYCGACEKLISEKVTTSDNYKEKLIKEATYFFYKEFDAVIKSIKSKKIITHIYGHLDLANDSIYYVKAHEKRLNSKEFNQFVTYFKSELHFASVDHFMEHLEVLFLNFINVFESNVTQEINLTNKDKVFWISQDLFWRVVELEKLFPKITKFSQKWVNDLSEKPTNSSISNLIEEYKIIEKENKLILSDNFFSVGYKLRGDVGYSKKMIKEGLLSASPNGFKNIDLNSNIISSFLDKKPTREAIGNRYLGHLKQLNIENRLADLECKISYSHFFNTDEFIDTEIFDDDEVILNSNIQFIQVNSEICKEFALKKIDINKFMIIKKLITGDVDLILVEEEFGKFLKNNIKCLYKDVPIDFRNDIKEHLIYLKVRN